MRVDELLGDRRAELRVGLVVLAHHLELDVLPPILIFLGVGLVDREVHAVLVVLAEVGDAAGQRAGVADLDGDDFLGRAAAAFGRFGLLRLFLAAAVDGEQRGRDERQAELVGHVHLISSG